MRRVISATDVIQRPFEGGAGYAISFAPTRVQSVAAVIRGGEVVSPDRGELAVAGTRVTAGRYSMNLGTRMIVAEGGVTITTTAEDGSTVTMRTDRMTIERP